MLLRSSSSETLNQRNPKDSIDRKGASRAKSTDLGKMFFFFVGGLEQQAGRVIKERAGRCIRCGSDADLVEYEKVLKLFFVPVWRWRGDGQAFYCRDCGLLWPQSLPPPQPDAGAARDLLEERQRSGLLGVARCATCERIVEPEFRFCPFCGAEL